MADGSTKDDGGQRRGGYLGFVAHEVRNPLSTALWSAELLSRMPAGERGGARGEKLTGMCLRSIGRVRQLVEDHFLCERLDAGGFAVDVGPVPVREAADAVLAGAPGGAGDVTVEASPDVAVKADRRLLERALDGLVAAAGRDGTPVRLAVQPGEAGGVDIVVSGATPQPGALEDPAKGSPSDPRGRALALPLVRRIASALGGVLAVTEVGYVLTLSRAQAYAAPPKPAPHP